MSDTDEAAVAAEGTPAAGDEEKLVLTPSRQFGDWLREHGDSDDSLMLLLLDCSKGFNFLAWSWIERCLRQARLPPAVQHMILAMLRCEARLVIHGREYGGLHFLAFRKRAPVEL